MYAADDFGHIVKQQPREVLVPRGHEDVVEALRRAAREGLRIAVRGRGHSVFGQAQVEGGLVLDMRALHHVEVRGDTAIVGAGASWGDVVRKTLEHGLEPPVLTDYVGLSVGGTLSVGGIGARSYRYGAQTDQVRAMTVVTGSGDVVRCSPEQHRDLFDTVRAGLGHVGVIVEVELPLVPAPESVRHYRIPYKAIRPLLHDLDMFVAEQRFDQVSAVGLIDTAGNWAFHIDAVAKVEGELDDATLLRGCPADSVIQTLPTLDYITRLDEAIEGWRTSGLWDAPHPWCDVFIPHDAMLDFAELTLASLGPDDLGTEGAMILIYPLANSSTPLLPLSGETSYLFDILRCNAGADTRRVEQILDDNRRIYENALCVNGTLYAISAVFMSGSDWRRHFGAGWELLVAAKQKYDPGAVLGPDHLSKHLVIQL